MRARRFMLAVVGGVGVALGLFLVDRLFYAGSGFPPPHLKVPGLFAPQSSRPGVIALLVDGGISPEKNHPRYWNNTSLIYGALEAWGVERIHVLQSDGTSTAPDRQSRSFMGLIGTGDIVDSSRDLNGDGRDDVEGPATKAALAATLAEIGRTMGDGDRLLLFLTDHGQLRLSGAHLRAVAMLWGEELSGGELDDLLRATLPASVWVAILATQCHGGIFLGEVTRPRTLLMASGWPLWIWSGQDYSVFPYHFAAALIGRSPEDGALLEPPATTLRAAFARARERDHVPEWPIFWVNGDEESLPAPF